MATAEVPPPGRVCCGGYSTSADLLEETSKDISVKLFCFAFLSELIEDSLGCYGDIRAHLHAVLARSDVGRGALNLDHVFAFLLDIQNQPEDAIEDFFAPERLRRNYLMHDGRDDALVISKDGSNDPPWSDSFGFFDPF